MEIRNRSGHDDLRGALEARNRAWRVGFRGVVEEDVIDDAVTDVDEESVTSLSDELGAEAGAFLVAVEGDDAGDDRGGAGEDDGGAVADDGDVVGFVRVRWGATAPFADALDAEVVELYVDPAHWRRGVGSALLSEGVDWSPATLDGVATSVLAANDRGRSFLEANGFERDGTTETDVGDAALEAAVYRRSLE